MDPLFIGARKTCLIPFSGYPPCRVSFRQFFSYFFRVSSSLPPPPPFRPTTPPPNSPSSGEPNAASRVANGGRTRPHAPVPCSRSFSLLSVGRRAWRRVRRLFRRRSPAPDSPRPPLPRSVICFVIGHRLSRVSSFSGRFFLSPVAVSLSCYSIYGFLFR